MNEAVKTMIERLHARLDDLSVVVDGVPYELAGYDKKLDKIDDQIYLIECEIEKKTAKSVPLEPVSEAESAAFDNATQAKDPKRTAAARALHLSLKTKRTRRRKRDSLPILRKRRSQEQRRSSTPSTRRVRRSWASSLKPLAISKRRSRAILSRSAVSAQLGEQDKKRPKRS